jgi:hypothetical protein
MIYQLIPIHALRTAHSAIHQAIGSDSSVAVIADTEVGDTGVSFEVVTRIALAACIAVLNWAGRIRVKDTVSAYAGIGNAEVSFDMKALITCHAEDITVGWAGGPFGADPLFARTFKRQASALFQSKAFIAEQAELGTIFDAGCT